MKSFSCILADLQYPSSFSGHSLHISIRLGYSIAILLLYPFYAKISIVEDGFMIQTKSIEKGLMEVKSTVRINHPKANLLTLQIGHDAACNFPFTVELAFSSGYYFLTEVIPEFSSYAYLLDDSERLSYYNMRSADHSGVVMTYHHVPLAALAKFLNIYAEKP